MKIQVTILLFILSSCSLFRQNQGPKPLPNSLDEAIGSGPRARENEDRDHFQHPKETLEFFGIKPSMTIVEINPGAGFWTEILAPYLSAHGQYVMAVPRLPSNPPPVLLENEKKLQDILMSHPDIQSKTRFVAFEPLNKRNLVKPAFADMVITFNTIHNWTATHSTAMALKFVRDVLKPGGTFGIVQHMTKNEKKNSWKTGYLSENEVIALVKRAGFKFVGKSEINYNPKDTTEHPGGVWALPPTYRLGQKDHRTYKQIGESNRMTLKFIK